MATTATETNLLEAQPRTPGNKNDARRVRRSGKIPGVVYGAGKNALSVSLDPRRQARHVDLLEHLDEFGCLSRKPLSS